MQASDSTPKFSAAPVVETVIGVQFDRLKAFRSHHYGLFWKAHLEPLGWQPHADETPLPTYREKFGEAQLLRNGPPMPPALNVRMKLKNSDDSQTLQIQHDKLYFGWKRGEETMPSYRDIRPTFDVLYSSLEAFADEHRLGAPTPNLWEITYINRVLPGRLWTQPKDWHRVLPRLFPEPTADIEGLGLATYDGTWYYEIEPKRGRLTLRVAKMLVNRSPDPVLCIVLTARGEL